MTTAKPLTKPEVEAMVKDWYARLDVHVPMVELLPLLTEDVEMVWPEGPTTGHAGFESWYQRVIRLFFDEVHGVKSVDVTLRGNEADVKVVVKWETSVWNPPAPKSERIILDAAQTWVVRREAGSDQIKVAKYTVDGLTYYPGSAKL